MRYFNDGFIRFLCSMFAIIGLQCYIRSYCWEKLRSEALNTMIDIAEKDLNISIRKKPGAQQ